MIIKIIIEIIDKYEIQNVMRKIKVLVKIKLYFSSESFSKPARLFYS